MSQEIGINFDDKYNNNLFDLKIIEDRLVMHELLRKFYKIFGMHK